MEELSNISNWNIDIANNYYEVSSSDRSTIGRVAITCNDLAWSLEITAQILKSKGHCVISTKRDAYNEAWLVLCKSESSISEISNSTFRIASTATGIETTEVSNSSNNINSLTNGEQIVNIAERHIGERYILGSRAPMGNTNWEGPWDCAEFASWCVYQASGILYGVKPLNNLTLADAYTGYWSDQSMSDGSRISVEEAAGIPGAMILRTPATNRGGHIVISDGNGGTIEAHSKRRGVIKHTISGRRWDTGIVVPGVQTYLSDTPINIIQPTHLLRLTSPMTRGSLVLKIQKKLYKKGFDPGQIDGIYGSQTVSAVRDFQYSKGLVPDEEVGFDTLKALKIKR